MVKTRRRTARGWKWHFRRCRVLKRQRVFEGKYIAVVQSSNERWRNFDDFTLDDARRAQRMVKRELRTAADDELAPPRPLGK